MLTVLDLQHPIISTLLTRMSKTYCRIYGHHRTRLGNLTCIKGSPTLPKLKSCQASTEHMELSELAATDETLVLDTLMICKHCRTVINTRRGMQVVIRGT